VVDKRLGLAVLILMTAMIAACGHNGAATSSLPAVSNAAGVPRSASALGSVQVTTPPPTLYVAGTTRVNSFPLAASGTPTPSTTLFVHRLQRDGLVGIAAAPAANGGTLDVLQDYKNFAGGPGAPNSGGAYPDCRVDVYAALASGDSAAVNQVECSGSNPVGPAQLISSARGLAITRSRSGGIDWLEALAGPVQLFDNTKLVAGHNSNTAVQATAVNDPSCVTNNPSIVCDGGVEFLIPAGLTFSQLTNLSTEYFFPTGSSCGTGTPRFDVKLSDGTHTGFVNIYIGAQPNYTACPANTWTASGNLVDPNNANDKLDTSQLPSGTFYDTVSAAQSKYGAYAVQQIFFVADTSQSANQTVLLDNTAINTQTFDYETTYIADVVQRADSNGNPQGVPLQLTVGPGTPSPQPMTLKTHHGIAESGSAGHIFVTSGGPPGTGAATNGACNTMATGPAQVDNYAPNASGPTASPQQTFTIIGRVYAGAIAASPDNATLYVATCDGNGFSWVDAIVWSGASGATHPTKSIGPFSAASVTALAVDAQLNIYVGLTDNPSSGTSSAVRVFPSTFTNGSKVPTRSIAAPVPTSERITGLAVSQ